MRSYAWFAGVGDDTAAVVESIDRGEAEAPDDWPALAVATGFVESEDAYYERLRTATIEATRAAVTERERATDQQLIHAVRAMDDNRRVANELAERVQEWAGSLFEDAGSGVEYSIELAERTPENPLEARVISLAGTVAVLATEADYLRSFVEQRTPDVAPNLAELAEPVLAARLIALAGGLEALAKKPSGTVQVLGAEDALFSHLRGRAPSPKHGVIFTHEAVRGTRREDRGSAARALAGKLSIAARVDHYSGEYKPELKAELDDRIATIRARGDR